MMRPFKFSNMKIKITDRINAKLGPWENEIIEKKNKSNWQIIEQQVRTEYEAMIHGSISSVYIKITVHLNSFHIDSIYCYIMHHYTATMRNEKLKPVYKDFQ